LSSPQFIGSLPVLQSQLRIYAELRAVAWRRPETAEEGLVGFALSGALCQGATRDGGRRTGGKGQDLPQEFMNNAKERPVADGGLVGKVRIFLRSS
jgi:hypothetical protein